MGALVLSAGYKMIHVQDRQYLVKLRCATLHSSIFKARSILRGNHSQNTRPHGKERSQRRGVHQQQTKPTLHKLRGPCHKAMDSKTQRILFFFFFLPHCRVVKRVYSERYYLTYHLLVACVLVSLVRNASYREDCGIKHVTHVKLFSICHGKSAWYM